MVGRKENSYLNKLGGRRWKLDRQRLWFGQDSTHFEWMNAGILLSHKQVGTPDLRVCWREEGHKPTAAERRIACM